MYVRIFHRWGILTKKPHTLCRPPEEGRQLNASRSTLWQTWRRCARSSSTPLRLKGTEQIQSETTNSVDKRAFCMGCYIYRCSKKQCLNVSHVSNQFKNILLMYSIIIWDRVYGHIHKSHLTTLLYFCKSPGRTTSPAGWTDSPWAAPEQSCLLGTPPTWCSLIQQTQPRAAACGCGRPGGDDSAHGDRTENLQDEGGGVKHRKQHKYTSERFIGDRKEEVKTQSLPSTKRAMERARRSTPGGTCLHLVLATKAIPEIPKNRYMVPCCQFISFTHDLLSLLYRWACGPSTTNCSTIIPATTT